MSIAPVIEPAEPEPYSKLRAYLELFRLPNVFTAIADVLMGLYFTRAGWRDDVDGNLVSVLLILASALMYTAGMVLNDVFDQAIDARERPRRPLPSGRIDPGWARQLGFGLLILGWACGSSVSFLVHDWRAAGIATLLAAAIVLYDRILKHTPIGPHAMGTCRLLNVLLGMSALIGPWNAANYVVAVGIGVYITGVTWFARTEADTSHRLPLMGGLLVLVTGIALLPQYPRWVDPDLLIDLVRQFPDRWNTWWLMLGVLISWRCVLAIMQPSPRMVQSAVRQCILSLIVLDAVVCSGMRDMEFAIRILVLLVPTMLLGRWIYST